MSSTSLTAPVDKGSKGGIIGASTLPLVSVCCIGLLLLLLASTIVLALIPIYLGTKDLPNLSTTSTQYLTLTPSPSVPALGDTSAADCATIANAMSSAVGSPGSLTPSQCTFATTPGRRRRAWPMSRTRRQGGGFLFIKIVINLLKCPRCRKRSNLTKWKGVRFSVSFFFFGPRTCSFTIASIDSSSVFNRLTTETSSTTTTTTSTNAATSANPSG
ncbi:unnamed protein product [Rotaria socialis]|uniref:Uncharacterized protein n=1 Tax=Rotaria socialis TaxID=392032 RepID=A0A821F3M2_9BILA|nr:unnamed protein product [Rotaria socialis]CAF4642346.1 unnamed protein product [Rotaria socialis]